MRLRIILAAFFYCTFAVASHPPVQSAAGDPNAILAELLKGNARFVAGTSAHPHLDRERRVETARNGQKPVAAVLSCADSRVPAEQLFDVGVGDLFVVRVAGNVAEKSQVGSLEYGAGHLGIPLIIVLGHTKCGAVTAAVEGGENASAAVKSILNNIEPAIARAAKSGEGLAGEVLVEKSISENVWQAIDDLFKSSEAIRSLVKLNKLKIVGAVYDIETGKVETLGVHYRQEQLLKKYSGQKPKPSAR